ncbi:MAG: 50S ribosomal protein L29 [Bacteroidia bacterium]|nr:50S ribosomal protein L29 [Bacteroidia bacterium]
MKIKDIRELTDEELKARIVDEEQSLLRVRLNHAVSAVERPSDIRDAKKMIARLKTILRERELEAETSKEAES